MVVLLDAAGTPLLGLVAVVVNSQAAMQTTLAEQEAS
jgi:hypothetical protein